MKTEESKFISLAAAAKMTNYSQDYISLLCRQGKLKAEKLGRNWVTTKEWVYEYVDKTEGKGASVVPVRIKETDKKEENKESVGEKKPAPRPLFGSAVLELAVFCTFSVIVLANTFGFSNGIREVDRNFNLVQDITNSQNALSAQRSAQGDKEEILTGVNTVINDQTCGAATDPLNLLAFDKETDVNVITQVTSKITASLVEPVTVEVYKRFAIVSYTSDAAKKSVYVIN